MMYLGQDAIGLNHTLPIIGQAALLESGTYTPVEDIRAIDVRISHSLGVIPDFCLYFSDSFESLVTDTQIYCANGYFSKCGVQSTSSTIDKGIGWYLRANKNANTAIANSWQDTLTTFFTDHDFTFPRYNSGEYLKAGITYHWVIGKFKEVTSNAS